MPTIADNVHSMAQLVKTVKRQYQLSENTVLRIVDMSFALAEQGRQPTDVGEDEDFPLTDPETGEPIMFPIRPEDIDEAEEPTDDDTNTGQIVVLTDNDVSIETEDTTTTRKDN